MIARILLGLVAIGVLWTAIAFAGFAVYLGLLESMLPWGAAAVTALIFFALIGLGFSIYYASSSNGSTFSQPQHIAAPSPAQNDSLVPALTQLAKEHPWLAVGAAAALGVADSMKKRA